MGKTDQQDRPGWKLILLLIAGLFWTASTSLMPACSPPGGLSTADAQSEEGEQAEEGDQAEEQKDEPEGTLVVGARLKNSPIRSFIEVSSDIESLNVVDIYSLLSGIQITAIHSDEGDYVKKGEVLAKLDSEEIELEVAQAEVAYEEAKHRRNKADVAVKDAAEREETARIQAMKAKKDFEKAQHMYDNDLISEDEYAIDSLTWEQAASELEIALLRNSDVALDLKLAGTELVKNKIAKDNAILKLSRTSIVAPFDGFITFRGATLGMTISNASHLFTLVDREELVANLFIPQEDLSKVRVGMDVLFLCDAVPGREFNGAVSVVNPVVDPGTGTVKLRAVLEPDEEGLLRPGMFVTARVITAAKNDALLVPRKAVFYDDEKPTFFLIQDGGTVKKIHFLPGGSTETDLEIASAESADHPIEAGTLIVIVGQDNLKDGDQVQVVNEIS